MADQKDRLKDYVEVADRIQEFKKKYPEGTLQTVGWQAATVGGQEYVIYRAAAYRTPDDERPGHGTAWEQVPGTTPYTKGSELMNAETAAWGRAIIAVGIPSKKVASKEEVEARAAGDKSPAREAVPAIPLDRAKAILDSAIGVGLAEMKDDVPALGPVLTAKLAELGVQSGKLGHLNVDQAEALEAWIKKEAEG